MSWGWTTNGSCARYMSAPPPLLSCRNVGSLKVWLMRVAAPSCLHQAILTCEYSTSALRDPQVWIFAGVVMLLHRMIAYRDYELENHKILRRLEQKMKVRTALWAAFRDPAAGSVPCPDAIHPPEAQRLNVFAPCRCCFPGLGARPDGCHEVHGGQVCAGASGAAAPSHDACGRGRGPPLPGQHTAAR